MFKNIAVRLVRKIVAARIVRSTALNTRLRGVKRTVGLVERNSINAHVSARRAVLNTAAGALTLS